MIRKCHNHTLQTNSGMNYLVMYKVYTDVGGIKIVNMYGRVLCVIELRFKVPVNNISFMSEHLPESRREKKKNGKD